MAPLTAAQTLLSPVELSYLHSSLSLHPPIRPDSRSPSQFRPLVAETDILPSTNGSARICFADGTEAIVGIKAEVENSALRYSGGEGGVHLGTGRQDEEMGDVEEEDGIEKVGGERTGRKGAGKNSWVEMTIEIPGYRDDDALPVFLAAMLNEALLVSGDLPDKLWINRRFHWKLYIDILLLSPPQSYPLPLLSLTTHLALLSTRLPKLKSEQDEDPLFDDDWDASVYLYPHHHPTTITSTSTSTSNSNSSNSQKSPRERPPITILAMAVCSNIIFDPTAAELAVADAILAISVDETPHSPSSSSPSPKLEDGARHLRLLAIRTIDLPSRSTAPGVPDSLNTAAGGSKVKSGGEDVSGRMEEKGDGRGQEGVWVPPRGGMKRGLVARMVGMVLGRGGVAEEVLGGLDGVEVG